MNKRRIIFFSIFGFYHLIIFLFTGYIDAEKSDLSVLVGMYKYIFLFKYGALLGLVLFGIDFVWSWKDNKTMQNNHESLQLEITNLKAKVYDFQEASKIEPDEDAEIVSS